MDMWLLAGMRVVVLTDLARFRLQSLSFFLLIILVCAWIVQRIWNYLGWDFPRLPKLSYGKALGVTVLWGLLFVIVLAMISGARDLSPAPTAVPSAFPAPAATPTIPSDTAAL